MSTSDGSAAHGWYRRCISAVSGLAFTGLVAAAAGAQQAPAGSPDPWPRRFEAASTTMLI